MSGPKILQLKITLSNINPPVWRRILIPDNFTFWQFHSAIQDVFIWSNGHLHRFYVGRIWDLYSDKIEIPNPYEEEEDSWSPDFDHPSIPKHGKKYLETITLLSQFLQKPKDKVGYVYDYGDDWQHRILLEKVLEYDPKQKYPQIIAGKRACPPEDCGGPWGYKNLIEILTNPKHKEHQDTVDWLYLDSAYDFDPEVFDLAEIEFSNADENLKFYQEMLENS